MNDEELEERLADYALTDEDVKLINDLIRPFRESVELAFGTRSAAVLLVMAASQVATCTINGEEGYFALVSANKVLAAVAASYRVPALQLGYPSEP
jgi:hypothetical protein